MQEKVYFNFLIFCAILSQGILAKLPEEDVKESSKLLVRQKRVINRRPGGETPVKSGDLPYVVKLRKMKRVHCIATILSQHTVITAARCVSFEELQIYTVFSGSSYSQHGSVHNVTKIKKHAHNPSRTLAFLTGIALITVNPPFVYSHTTCSIGLHSGPVLTGMEGIVAGWGTKVDSGPVETAYPQRLRVIGVPIMNHRECQNIYSGHFPITEEDICTYHAERLCGDTDAGAPLVIGNELAGVHIGRINTGWRECPIKPDVFVLLQHLNYGPWIMRNIED